MPPLLSLLLSLFLSLLPILTQSTTDANDYAVLKEFLSGLDNPEILSWPANNQDPCGPPLWPHVYCSGDRITQIQLQSKGVSGTLPPSFNKLAMLSNLGFQNNKFRGKLPSFNGLSNLKFAFLNGNQFDTIPYDFFVGLTSLLDLSLDDNPLNVSTGGWTLPQDLASSAQLVNLTLVNCGLVGPIPDFLGNMSNLITLSLSYNNLTGEIPSSFYGSSLQSLWLNNQAGPGLSGPIDIISSMNFLTQVWFHGNQFSGPIPDSIGALTSLNELWLNSNQLVGLIPVNLTSLPKLESLQLDNNLLMGPIPSVKYNFTYSGNSFCTNQPGVPCAPHVTSLLTFLHEVNYPTRIDLSWSGNDPCAGNWMGIACSDSKVVALNLPNFGLNGTISPDLGNLDSLVQIKLGGNNLTGQIPANLTNLKSLKLLNFSSNNLAPPVPKFAKGITVILTGNPLIDHSGNSNSPSSPNSPDITPNNENGNAIGNNSKKVNVSVIAIPILVLVGGILIALIGTLLYYYKYKGKKKSSLVPENTIVVHPRDSSDPESTVKFAIANGGGTNSGSPHGDLPSAGGGGGGNVHVIEAGNFVISVQVLRNATKNFSKENILGRGGFGVVYKGELHDGTMIAVKRMESTVVSTKAMDEFQAEIAMLTKVRHRNLVSILGYSIEGQERLIVYEYMPQGALSKHLFQWRELNLEPLSWKRRLSVALDVARGVEYLHSLASQCFIHRDLKSANILLGDDFRAKVSDFGLVKLAPDGKFSVATRLAGTFGYLAPEYAVTGKITTKSDVFSYGVVLMELITGLTALDETRPEETRYLASWFSHIRSNRDKLKQSLDPTLALDLSDEETFDGICTIADLAGHCTAREPSQRPDMGHTVNVLVPLVQKWRPVKDEQEEYMGIDLHQPLLQMVKCWQDMDHVSESMSGTVSTVSDRGSLVSWSDSKGSIPARPAGFAESFTSADGR